ncbi:MAG: hypothetical protein KAH21_04310 [Spirochaetaceae bacterium]|nr:hypothetical protein [Spirochaetaceae bacterium]
MSLGTIAGNISSLQISRYSRTGHRMTVPVKPSQTVFAQYRNISGTPASSGQSTVSLSKVQLLNSLINNLEKMKHSPGYNSETSKTSPERADALIQQYASELHQVMKSTPVAFGTSGGSSGSGIVFNLSA